MESLLAATLAFAALHVLPATPLRPRLVRLLGSEERYAAVFSAAAALLLIWLIRAFAAAPFDPPLWMAPPWWFWLKPVILLLAILLAAGGVAVPNPSTSQNQAALDAPAPARGVLAITRHPVMWGVALWAAAHLASQPNLRGLLFFGGLGAVALGGSWLQQERKARSLGDRWARFEAATSFWPFAAIVAGRARLRLADFSLKTVIAALIVWLAFLLLHEPLIGVPALPQLL